ncbi:kinase-like domain-containing protein, partial [Baffinella frigidus]
AQKKSYTEAEVAKMIRDVLSACQHMHVRSIVHCDLKPENILFESEAPDALLCVTDFGLAQLCYHGTLDYMAPELIVRDEHRSYDSKCDVWSVGCLMYVLLGGNFPFRRQWGNMPQHEVLVKYRTGQISFRLQVEFKGSAWSQIDQGAKDLVVRMLTKDYTKRPSAAECLDDPWL